MWLATSGSAGRYAKPPAQVNSLLHNHLIRQALTGSRGSAAARISSGVLRFFADVHIDMGSGKQTERRTVMMAVARVEWTDQTGKKRDLPARIEDTSRSGA